MKRDHEDTLYGYRSRFAIGVSVLLLALAVFGWGLHSKLSLYHLRASARHSAPIAKLLSEREQPSLAAHHTAPTGTPQPAEILAASALFLFLPKRQDPAPQQRDEASPPPSRAFLTAGPLLHRPPPHTSA